MAKELESVLQHFGIQPACWHRAEQQSNTLLHACKLSRRAGLILGLMIADKFLFIPSFASLYNIV